MRTYSAQFSIRVRRHEREPLERDLVDGFYIHDMPNEMQLRQRVREVARMNRPYLGDRCGIMPTSEQSALMDMAMTSLLDRMDAPQVVDRPYQLLFEKENDYGTVMARLWINVTLSASRPHRVAQHEE